MFGSEGDLPSRRTFLRSLPYISCRLVVAFPAQGQHKKGDFNACWLLALCESREKGLRQRI